ncbi:MAG: acyl-CoA/acyl-ACP dehydrogenase [Dehalococcoidales bacterium]|nr:acyl-CoA/acyl-ACP dehydrogenase [Dehalococcoidales bacterium]
MRLDLSFTESEEMLRKAAIDFLKRDAPKPVIQSLQESDTGYTPELWQKAVDMGWLGIVIPEAYGGTGGSLTSAAALFEALGTGPMPGPYFSSGILSALIIMEAAAEEQKKQILPELTEGKRIITLALTEPEFGWEPSSIRTSIKKDGNQAVVKGVKLFTYDALAATHFIVVARNGSGMGSEGISLVLVDSKANGVTIRKLPGFLSSRIFEVTFDAVKVPLTGILGEENKGWLPLQTGIAKAIPVLCAYKVGASQNVIEQTIEYSRTRLQFGQAIGRFQRVQDWIIDMANYADAARLTTYEALWKLDTGKPSEESIHLAKAVASEAYFEVVTLAHRVFSGISYSQEHAISFHTRASRSLFNYLGQPAYHRREIARLITA